MKQRTVIRVDNGVSVFWRQLKSHIFMNGRQQSATGVIYFIRVILTYYLYPDNNINMDTQTYTAFNGHRLLTHGELIKVALKVKHKLKVDPHSCVLIFSDLTGIQMDLDLRGTDKEIEQRLKIFVADKNTTSVQGRGRPKLGVVAREISLLPRHWEWLASQSTGASATIRWLIEDARKKTSGRETIRQAQERTYKFMTAIGGNLPGYEEALRALYAKDEKRFHKQLSEWPKHIKDHVLKLSAAAFDNE